jgi:hypothetical protein
MDSMNSKEQPTDSLVRWAKEFAVHVHTRIVHLNAKLIAPPIVKDVVKYIVRQDSPSEKINPYSRTQ